MKQLIVGDLHGHNSWEEISAYEKMHHFYHIMGLLPVPNTCIFQTNFSSGKWQIIDPQLPEF